MSLTLQVSLPLGRYDAGGEDPRGAEWPPHPARVHCALVAAVRDGAGAQALRWLESLPEPQVWSEPLPLGVVRRGGYVVTNRTEQTGGNQFHPGRQSKARSRAGATLATSGFALVWPDADPDHALLDAIRSVARDVPYLGRADGLAVVDASDRAFKPVDGWVCHLPHEGADFEAELRVAYPGYTEALQEQYAVDAPAWMVARRAGYRKRDPVGEADGETARSEPTTGYADMVTYALPVGMGIDGVHAGLVTARLRNMVMGAVGAALGGDLPSALSGHGADGRPHVAFVPLLDVGHPHARGHLVGVGIAMPVGEPAVRRAVLAGLGDASRMLSLPFGEVELEPAGRRLARTPNRDRSRLSATYWTRSSRRWATVTPVVLDRFPKRAGVEGELSRACVALGLPEPQDVVIGAGPMVRGGAPLRRRHLPRREDRPRLFTHAVITFPVPVSGALLLGAQRYLGIGLFAPVADPPEAAEVTSA